MKFKKILAFALTGIMILGNNFSSSAGTSTNSAPYDGIPCKISSTCTYNTADGAVYMTAGNQMRLVVTFSYIDRNGISQSRTSQKIGQGTVTVTTPAITGNVIWKDRVASSFVYIDGSNRAHIYAVATY